MNPIEQYFYRIGLFKFSEEKLTKWADQDRIDKIVYASKNGLFQIKLKCVALLIPHADDPLITEQLKHMIMDEIEVVSEAAIQHFEKSEDIALQEKISAIRERRAIKKKREQIVISSNLHFDQKGKAKPSERLMNRLRDQRSANEPPYWF